MLEIFQEFKIRKKKELKYATKQAFPLEEVKTMISGGRGG